VTVMSVPVGRGAINNVSNWVVSSARLKTLIGAGMKVNSCI